MPLLYLIAYGVTYLASAELGHFYSIEPGHMATFWPPAGLYLAAVVAVPLRYRWSVVAVSLIANVISDCFLHGKPLGICIGFSLANTCEALCGGFLLQLRQHSPKTLLLQINSVKCLLLTAFIAPVLGASLGTSTILLSHQPDENLWQIWLVWWIADAVGILVIAPIVITCINMFASSRPLSQQTWQSRTLIEFFCMLLLVFILVEIVFNGSRPALSFTFLLIPVLLWPALRFGTVAVGIVAFAIALLVTGHTIQGTGPFSDPVLMASERAILVQSFIAASTAPFLALAALIHERERFAEELEEKILERTQQLNEADQRKDHFLAVLAHELRNPIAPLSNSLSVWPMVVHDPAAMTQLREIMQRQLRHMVRLVDDLLDVSRITRGKIKLQCEVLDIRDVVRDASETVRPLTEAASQKLDVQLPSSPLMVKADRARLLQIIGNLLNNASKYTGQEGKIGLFAEAIDDAIQLHVQDNGPGIPADQIERIFEMFTQVDQTLERSHGGLGIGLTLARRLVELHEGTISVKSDGVGCGATFTITLPAFHSTLRKDSGLDGSGLIAANPHALLGHPHAKSRKLPQYHVVVVDDARESAQTLAMMLQSLHQQVTVVYDGQSAMEAIHRIVPQIAFVDIAMPGMNGYEVAKRVKEIQANKSCYTMLIALTGFGQEHDRQRAFAAGFDHHLIKPASLDQIIELLRSRME